jgi:hypothetical protein
MVGTERVTGCIYGENIERKCVLIVIRKKSRQQLRHYLVLL